MSTSQGSRRRRQQQLLRRHQLRVEGLEKRYALDGGSLFNFVPVGNAGNSADPATGSLYGDVDYEYSIGQYEITIGQYTEFLNAVASTDSYGLYNPSMSSDAFVAGINRTGTSGSFSYAAKAASGDTSAGAQSAGNRPITYVDWHDAARFANWMHNGRGPASTEDGAYDLNSATDGGAVARSPSAKYAVPTEDEWYKAAYYSPDLNGGSGGYYAYATQSNTAPGISIGDTFNQANYFTGRHATTPNSSATYQAGQNYLTDVGAFSGSSSYYGTFDQTGNVWEWNDLDGLPSSQRGFMGGMWNSTAPHQRSNSRWVEGVWNQRDNLGFRLVELTNNESVFNFVPVGNAGNSADPATGSLYGDVDYEYSIGQYEITIGQYTEFLNAVASTDSYGLYNPSMSSDAFVAGINRTGTSGSFSYAAKAASGDTSAGAQSAGNRPITYVDWHDAARFANWMHNGRGPASTEDGAYDLNSATDGGAVARSPSAKYAVPTEDEWYKAAYYSPDLNGGSGGYYAYATQSNTAPGISIGDTFNQANYFTGRHATTPNSSATYQAGQNYLTDVGAFSGSSSYYGTFDQTGNVWEWNDLDGLPSSQRGFMGGMWNSTAPHQRSNSRWVEGVWNQRDNLGFRLVELTNNPPSNDLPTGSVTITGTAREDEVLTASNTLADADGLGAISYQWKRDTVAISGATNSTYTLVQADVGAAITVTASYTDQGGTNESVTSAATTTVDITPAPNGPPTDLSLSYSTVGESSQGATVGQLTTTDSDAGDIFTYSLVSGSGSTDNSLFFIEGDYLRVGANLDYETSTTANVRIRTTDSHGEYFEKAFVIGVQNYNEPPTDISLSSTTVPEKQSAGTVVGTLTSTDPDGSNFAGFAESFTYSLTVGDGDTDNSFFEIIEDELRTKESFDYDVRNSYSVRIQTEDNMGVPFEKQFLINVTVGSTNNPLSITSFEHGLELENSKPTITGFGTSGASIEVFADLNRDGTTETSIGTTTVASDDSWSLTSDEWLPGGPVNVSATQNTGASEVSTADGVVTVRSIRPGNLVEFGTNLLADGYINAAEAATNITLRSPFDGSIVSAGASFWVLTDTGGGGQALNFAYESVGHTATVNNYKDVSFSADLFREGWQVIDVWFLPSDEYANRKNTMYVTKDTVLPEATLGISDNSISSDETATVSITLSEAVSGLDVTDFVVSGGTISNLSGTSPNLTATFTPNQGFSGTATISIAADTFTDVAGNPNTESSIQAFINESVFNFVPVGNAGNSADPATGSLYGDVDYEYSIGQYEITIGQYTEFLNAVASTDSYGLYNPSMSSDAFVAGINRTGTSGSFSYAAKAASGDTSAGAQSAGNRPITYVDWHDAARFANWMHNGRGPASTEDGAYDLNSATDGGAVARSPSAKYAVPTEDEWYKAAYYSPDLNGGSGGYYAYATQSNTAPGISIGDTFNQANYFTGRHATTPNSSATYQAGQNYLTDVGAFSGSSSYYGTFDQTGNVWEWNDLDGLPSSQRGFMGGMWNSTAPHQRSNSRWVEGVWNQRDNLGFRLVELTNNPPSNDLPTLDEVSDININEDAAEQTVNLTGITAGGGETQVLSVTAVSDNTGLIPDPIVTYSSPDSTGALKFTPVVDEFGTATITVTVEDGGLDNNLATLGDNGITNRTVFIAVAPTNDKPTLNALSDININEDAAEQTVNLTGITAGGGETQVLSVTAISDNTGLIPDPTVTYSSPDSTGALKFTPVVDEFGTATITVTVEDGGLDNDLGTPGDNGVINRTVFIAVAPTNDKPTLNALSDININEDAAEQTVNLTGITAGGGETQVLRVTVISNYQELVNPTITYSSADPTGTLFFTPAADQFGTVTILVNVEDGGLDNDLTTPGDNATFDRIFSVTVTQLNDRPTLDEVSDINLNEDAAEQTVNLTGITAGGGETQVLSVTAVSDNTGLIPDPTVTYSSADSTATLKFTPVADQSGTATITVTVEDGGLDNDLGTPDDNGVINRTVTVITEAVNDEPTLDVLSDININEDDPEQTVNLTGITAGGGETQVLSVTATSDNTGLIPDLTVDFDGQSSTGTLKFTPVADQVGTATITVTVTDGGLDNDLGTPDDNGSILRTVVVKAEAVNDAPVLDPAASPQLAAILEDAGAPVGQVGTLVSALIDAGGTYNNFGDVDGDLPAIAITDFNLNGGTLYYSIDDGVTWSEVIAVSVDSALGLYADETTRIYFQPASNFDGTISDVITFQGWDRSGASANGDIGLNTSATVVGSIDTPGLAYEIALSNDGSIAYLAERDSNLQIFDVSDPNDPNLVGTLDNPHGLDIKLSKDGTTAFIAAWDAGLIIADVQDPTNPTTIGSLDSIGKPIRITLSADENTAYVADWDGNLQIINIVDRESPSLIATLGGFGTAHCVTLSPDGTIAHVSDYYGGLRIVDVSDPSNPAHITSINTTGNPLNHSLSSDGKTAYVAAYHGGLWIVDVSTPENPELISRLDTTSETRSISISEGRNLAYVADWHNGVHVVDISNPAVPEIKATIDTHGANRVRLSSDQSLAYVPDWDKGLKIIDLSQGFSVDSDSVSVDIIPVNGAPTLDELSDVNILEDASEQTVNLTGITAGGSETQVLLITAVSDNTGLIPDPTVDFDGQSSTATLKFTPVADQFGTATITVTVEDGGLDNDLATQEDNGFINRTVFIAVAPTNDVPTLDALSDVNINEDAPEQTVSLTGITAGGSETQVLSVTAVSDNTGLIPDPTVDFDGQSSTGTLKFTPIADQFGTATITVTVTDGGLDDDLGTPEDNGIINRTVTVITAAVNDEPTLDSVSDLVLSESSLTQVLDITGITVGGSENQPLQVTALSSNPSLVLHPTVTSRAALGSNTRLLTVTPLPDQYGIATVTVTVEDGGLDLDLNTAEDNATFSQTFDVTITPDTDNPPSSVTPHGKMFIHETLSGDSLVSYQLPAVNVNGEAINGLLNRITPTSSDTALISDPTVLYASADVPSSLSFTPVANASGTATLSIQVEDGGLDNNFATTEDNRQATHQVEVNVLEVISNQGLAILAKDSTENLYVNTQPVIYHEQQAQSTIAGFAAIGASTENGENALLVQRASVTNRLVTDDAWRINGLFDSLQNESSPVLDLSAREVSSTLNVVAISGAYEINGVNNPILIVRRGQTYTFNLNAAGHPFYLQTTGNGYQSANTYSGGFTGNGQTNGEHEWIVPQDAPDEIFYQCEFHSVMFGKIIVID